MSGPAGRRKGALGPVRTNAKHRYLAGCRAFRFRQYQAAIADFSKAIFLDSENSAFFLARAKAYRELGDFKSALVDFRAAARMDPDNDTYRRRLSGLLDVMGHLHLDAKAYLAARQYFTEAILEEKLVTAYWLHRCVANIHLEDWEAALSDVDRALFLDSRNADAHVLRAKLYWKLGKEALGNADMTAAVALDPDHPEVVEFEEARWSIAEAAYQEGASLMLLHDCTGAILELNRALELAPDDVKTRVLRAAAYRDEGNYADSLRDVEYAARTFRQQLQGGEGGGEGSAEYGQVEHPEISRQRNLTLNAVAVLQHERGNYEHALTLYNKVIQSETAMAQLHDRNVDARFLLNRGDTHMKMNNLQQALADFHRAFDCNPRDDAAKRRLAVVHDQFGVQLFNEGLIAQAEVEFSTAVEYNPAVATFYLHRGDAAQYLQKPDLAYRDYKRASELDPSNQTAARKVSQFTLPPGVSRGLLQTKRRGLKQRRVNASVPAKPSQRPVGGRRGRRKQGNLWETARKRELSRSGAHSGWLLEREEAKQAAAMTMRRQAATPQALVRASTAPAGASRRSSSAMAVPQTSVQTMQHSFVGPVTGEVIDRRAALSSTSWVDGRRRSGSSGSARRRSSKVSKVSGSTFSRRSTQSSFPRIIPPPTPSAAAAPTGVAAVAAKMRAASVQRGPGLALGSRTSTRGSTGRPGSRGYALPSPVTMATTTWKGHSMGDIRQEVLPQRPQSAFFASFIDEPCDYRTTYYDKAKAFALSTADKAKDAL